MRKFFIKLMVAGALLGAASLFFAVSINVPDLNKFEERKIAQSTKIYDRTGQILLYDVHGDEKRTLIPFEKIPRHIKNAAVALEDDNFYSHYGFRPLSFLRAVITNLLRGNFEHGGSTITQQVVKNTLLTPEKTIIRKIKEIIIALKLERTYSKDEILNAYLNQIPYGSGAYGIEAAAETFLGKQAEDLTILEAAYLSALPNAPSYYSPYGKHRKELDDRAYFTLEKMRRLGFLSEKEYESAKGQKIQFVPYRTQGIIAPHFVIEVKDELNKKFGEDVVERGGFRVITTLDVGLQRQAEEIINKYAEANEKNFNAKNESVVAISPKTGDILAMVGSRDYFDMEREGNFNVVTAHRQPGSAFKPFVYATAFKKGYTPETMVFDLPTEFNPLCNMDGKPAVPDLEEDKCYHPQNFDEKFRGPVSLRESLAQSLNVPSVKTLYLAGLEDSLATARDFGITSLNDPQRYGLTLVLGGGEVSLLELVSAYSVFANDGMRNPYRYILKIEGAGGETIFTPETAPQEVINNNIARAINDILSDNKARAPSFGEFSALYFPGKKVAAKTGTTNDYKDAWVVGYTPDIAIGAWAGNNDNAPMEKKVAGFIVAPWWHEIVEYALINFPNEGFAAPDQLAPVNSDKPYLRGEWRGNKEFIVDKISGKLATKYTPQDMLEKRVVYEIHSILYWVDKSSPQLKNWEDPIRSWASANKLFDQDESVIPKNYDDVHIPENFPKILKVQLIPQKNIYQNGDTIVLRPVFESKFGVQQIDYFANEEYVGGTKKYPFEIVFLLNNLQESNVKIKLKAYDAVGNIAEAYLDLKKEN